MKQVSIILPTHNRAETLARAIHSVLNQSYASFELLVVDDASSDGTNQVLQQFDDQRIKYLRLPEHRGAGGARNAGIAQSIGEFVAFQDSDDEWIPSKLAKQVPILEDSVGNVGLVYSDMLRVSKNANETYLHAPIVNSSTLIDPVTKQYCTKNIGIQSCLIKKDCLTEVGGFNESLPAFEDLELFIRLSQRFQFQHLPQALVRYYETVGISSDSLSCNQARRMILQLHGEFLLKDKWFIANELAATAARC